MEEVSRMSKPIVVIDTSVILEGKLGELETAIHGLAAFVEANERRPIPDNVYLTEDRTRMTVVQVHPDSVSMEFHMNMAGPAFAKFEELIKLSTMDVFGEPSDHLLEQIQQKVQMLGDAVVSVHELYAGFDRFGGYQ
jgi:hypothetical protein